ncbi:MAG: DUF1349 domain-containing protein [Allorhizobium sp.]
MAFDADGMTWLNPPPRHDLTEGGLSVTTGDQTDFWQGTYYGFHHDNGHFLHRRTSGNFTAEIRFSGEYRELYDQAGLMIRHDARHWMKCGIEYTDGVCHFSTVVTNGHSDWSAIALTVPFEVMHVRLTRLRDSLFVQYRVDETAVWRMARLAYFPPELDSLQVGVTACSPQRSGFEATFLSFELTDPVSGDIH